MSDQVHVVRAKRGPDGAPLLDNTRLMLGAHTIVFENGVARVNDEQLALLRKHRDDVDLDGVQSAPAAAADHARGLPDGLLDANEAELAFLAGLLQTVRASGFDLLADADTLTRALQAALSSGQAPVADPTGGGDGAPQEPQTGATDPSALPVSETEVEGGVSHPNMPEDDEQTRLAKQHLREEGEHVPKSLPPGFDAVTGEGEPRCYAAKADGGQCANAAKTDDDGNSTYACGLPKHQQQVAQLP